ncbi:hypothetical protein HJC22_15330 [Corallococcus exiguus]|uniref:hypothetical protein n=1 Tax=Corallococcus exiguus TaxID=83462 RepID=UPI001471D819|nr:hypothetical protein [Corallococcus exiguus]NNC17091.1 hypothetical protein [Corallococcus exiguus]
MTRYLSRLPHLLPFAVASVLAACGGEERDPGDGPGDDPSTSGCVRTISTALPSTTTWAPGAERCSYEVQGVVEVRGALTLAPGTVVRFGPDAGLLVTATGSLHAVGTEAALITFTGTTPTPGFWRGLAFKSNTPENALEHVVISYAGSEQSFCCDFFYGPGGRLEARASVLVGSNQGASSQVRISHTTVEKSGTQGLFVFNKARLPGFSRNLFRGNLGAPVVVSLSTAGALDGASIYSGNSPTQPAANGDNVVHLVAAPEADTATAQTLRRLDVPYGVSTGLPDTTVEYAGALTLEPGVRLQFEAESGLRIKETGSLVARGTAEAPIVFTGRTETPGFWKGISILSLNPDNVLAHARVSHGGSDPFCCDYFTRTGDIRASISVGSGTGRGQLQLTDSLVSQGAGWGVFVFKNGTFTQSASTYDGNADGTVGYEAPPLAP